ncbi:aldehyde dehydrogenase [Dasania sp. GY-MA-18]|uniref:Aldehyde dehydrogenase n=1 Tax=Dasania phycosphaerae TaxID=2950436 RepID=A0A9J6RLI5_9GAMM|nr:MULTISPECIES: aldehyde dehydrogenase [Dasania]MCR8923150.1 aldehyde dehydrogenase [Dasania sp. GY-MA-18]MCZ0865582.1 aldehyde dehydrogenase [Dasania phycosphaerae]MCZ0869307.1 aldehyde dehydrogenase [Dasania phycosphaerae]
MSDYSYEYWQTQAKNIQFKNQSFINGEYRAAQSGATYDVISPASEELLAQVSACDEADVDAAVACARSSFDSGVWANRSPAERKAVVLKLAQLILEHKDELALLETLDMGKPVMDALNVDVMGASAILAWYAEAADKIYDEIAPTGDTALATMTREAIGVVAAIVPWNFPLDIAIWKLGPALVAGNSVIIKPAEQSPHSVLRLAELAIEAGVPKGVFNVVTGYGHVAGKALGLHNDVDVATFTGSTEVGKLFLRYSSESNMKPVWLETGGKSPNIIFADCENLDKAADKAAFGIFFNQGEVCSANSRLLVENSIKDQFVEKMVARAKAVVLGDPLNPETTMGPIVNRKQADRMLSLIEQGKKEGGKLVAGGTNSSINGSSLYVQPTIFDGVNNDMTIAREEIFGPVLSVIGFDTEEEAIAIANDTPYGLAASVWTDSLNRAHRVAKKIKAGTVSVNTVDALSPMTPFGGFKQSGIGRDLSIHAFDKFTQVKTTWIDFS